MTRIEDVFDYIDTIPNYDSGKVFGLSPLANDQVCRYDCGRNDFKLVFCLVF